MAELPYKQIKPFYQVKAEAKAAATPAEWLRIWSTHMWDFSSGPCPVIEVRIYRTHMIRDRDPVFVAAVVSDPKKRIVPSVQICTGYATRESAALGLAPEGLSDIRIVDSGEHAPLPTRMRTEDHMVIKYEPIVYAD